jgi:Glycine rich protein/Domain of unknown function DUF11
VGIALAVTSSAVAVQASEAPAVALQGTCTPSAGFTYCVTFDSIGADYSFTVPANVAGPVAIKAWGGGGGGVNPTYSSAQPGGGAGAFAGGNLTVPGGTQLTVMVGGGGHTWRPGVSPGRTYGGGGSGGTGGLAGAPPLGQPGSSGGGMSGVFVGSISAANAAVIAGGGGGASPGADKVAIGSITLPSVGGGGGSNTDPTVSGQSGTSAAGGAAATASAPAPCPTPPTAGSQLAGGNGGGTPSGDTEGGGGGGGGWFGGGGGRCQLAGGSDPQNGPGGGGSSYIGGAGVTAGVTIAGANATVASTPGAAPNTTDPHYVAGVAMGGSVGTPVREYGGPGYVVLQYNLQAPCGAPTPIVLSPSATTAIAQGTTASFTMTGGMVAASPLPTASYTWTVSPAAGVIPLAGTGTTTGNIYFGSTGNFTVTFIATNTSSPPYCSPAASSTVSVAQAVSPAADVTVAVSTANIVPGTSGDSTIIVANAGPGSAAGPITLSYSPPNGATIASLPPRCTGPLTGPISCAVPGPLPSGVQVPVIVSLTVPANAAPSVPLTGGSATAVSPTADPSPGNNIAASSIATQPGSADVSVAVATPSLIPGTSGPAVITVTNSGPSHASGPLTAVYTPPAGLDIESLPAECTGAIPSGPLTCTFAGPLAPNGAAVVTVPVRLPANASPSTTRTGGSVTANSPTADPSATNNAARADVTVLAGAADLSIAVTIAPISPALTGDAVMSVSNAGPSDAAGPIAVSFTPPTGTSITSVPAGCAGTLPSGPLTCTIAGPITPNSTAVIAVPLSMTSIATIGAVLGGGSATVQSPTNDPAAANNTAAAPVTVGPGFDLVPDITTVGPLVRGNTAHIELSAMNNGDGLAPGTSLTVTLPAGLTFVGWERLELNAVRQAIGETGTLGTVDGQSVTYPIGDIAPHAVARVVLVARVEPNALPGEVTFVLDAAAARGTELVVANNRALVVATIQGELPATGLALSSNMLELGALLLAAGVGMNVTDQRRRTSALRVP